MCLNSTRAHIHTPYTIHHTPPPIQYLLSQADGEYIGGGWFFDDAPECGIENRLRGVTNGRKAGRSPIEVLRRYKEVYETTRIYQDLLESAYKCIC